ncbi:MAG: thiamine diphosphokinase [Ruminococcaceae bacterium]|nr:thiamine diphosphokinase [Oscillospiraceae bacterium]
MGKGVKRCVILSAGPVDDYASLRSLLLPDDYMVAADGGLRLAQQLGVIPHEVVADFDSGDPATVPPGTAIARLPVEKDVTDTAAAVQIAVRHGFDELLLLGCTGGRLDHQYANLLLLTSLSEQGVHAVLADERNRIEAVMTSPVVIPCRPGWQLSLFAFGAPVENLCIHGAHYALENYRLLPNDPLCISNRIVADKCEITFRSGMLLIFQSCD